MINRLPQELINQIAAGEVVVRPASVVKELIENSLDAGARRIVIQVANEMRDVCVIDDGDGIAIHEAALALERHATSKIARPKDLEKIRTRGFRGEALASIAAVSKLEMQTRTAQSLAGVRLVVWGGELRSQNQTGCPAGTRIEARELFYNTPARLKFLKSAAGEWNQLALLVAQQALSRCDAGFRLEHDERAVYDLPAGQSLPDRFVQLCGRHYAEQLLPVELERAGVTIRGLASRPAVSRRDRRQQYFFVNGRPVANRVLWHSLQEAYRGLIMTRRFPAAILFIELDPAEVDVNVHPTKEEVRFREERKVAGLLNRAVVAALERSDLKPELELSRAPGGAREAAPQDSSPQPSRPPDYGELFDQAARRLQLRRETPAEAYPPAQSFAAQIHGRAMSPEKQSAGHPQRRPEAESVAALANGADHEANPIAEPDAETDVAADLRGTEIVPEALGQFGATYILAAGRDELILIDQHAAHERLLFENFRSRQNGARAQQQLLVPLQLEIEPALIPALEELAPLLAELGFDLQPFGGHTYNIDAVPAELDDVDVEQLLRDLLDQQLNGQLALKLGSNELTALRDAALASMACHAAIRAGQILKREEMQRLIEDLYNTPTAYTCPHGRPTVIRLRKSELDRQFGRRE